MRFRKQKVKWCGNQAKNIESFQISMEELTLSLFVDGLFKLTNQFNKVIGKRN